MFDSKGRNIHYLRLSVTDLCNLRCRYCMPDGVDKLEREDILTYEEFLRLAALFARCGVDTVRVTGGEPLVRKGVEQLVKGLKAIPRHPEGHHDHQCRPVGAAAARPAGGRAGQCEHQSGYAGPRPVCKDHGPG